MGTLTPLKDRIEARKANGHTCYWCNEEGATLLRDSGRFYHYGCWTNPQPRQPRWLERRLAEAKGERFTAVQDNTSYLFRPGGDAA